MVVEAIRKGFGQAEDVAADLVRPTVDVRAGELHLMATDGERALMLAGAPIYARGDRIVRPIVDDMQAANGLRTKVARLTDVGCDSMVDHLSRSADWLRYDGRKKDTVLTDPPIAVAKTILSRDGEWSFPRLAGVITTPTLRPDGSLLCKPGFDAQTQLLLIDPSTLPSIPSKPSRRDAMAALETLDALLAEFPFVDDASRSVALSGLITPVVRGALPVAPLHAVAAPVAGSGKSYIVDIASAIGTGQRAPVIAAGNKDDETEKRLISALLNGQAIISIDNVNGQLGGDVLCQMIERPLVSVRPLGVSKLIRLESRATTFATGNNIQLVGDMTRRVVLCSLDPNMERPELRQFQSRPFDLVLGDRGKYVAAALMIARAYVSAGFPGELPALASFEDWSRVVRSALVWLGRADPVETMETARAEDPTTSSLRALFGAWADTIGDAERTSAQIKERAREEYMGNLTAPDLHQAVHDVAQGNRGEIDAKRLGHFLTRHKGRIIDGLKLKDRYDTARKVNVWSIVRV
jgi:putative DNA primase/helicase